MPGLPSDLERAPPRCPNCGGRGLRKVKPQDVEVYPLDPDRAPDATPGVLKCKRCGTIVHWGP